MTTTTAAKTWTMPDLDTTYHTEEGAEITLGQMLDGVDPELTPTDQTMLEDLLWAFGAWEDLAEMNAAMEARVYTRGLDGKLGFTLVK